jgi:hypothetical protein
MLSAPLTNNESQPKERTMPSYVVKLPAQIDGTTIDWTGAKFHDLSVWGGGNGGKDLWGWGGSGECTITDPRSGESSVLVTLDNPSPETGELMGVVARFTLKNGKFGCLGGVLQQSH